ncbi:MAG: CHAD domain-containing protein [Thermoleophilaceae bacterium]|nr:CHAD domain-containing protein [Thermoleophilaceae bacterium]
MAERRHVEEVVIGAAVAGGALAAAKLGWDRLSGDRDQRKFELRPGEPVPEGIERIALGQLDGSIEGLAGEGDSDRATAIHETRKSLKRLRATARLTRHQLGDRVFTRDNQTFRDVGKRLSAARDSRVLLDTLAELSERYPRVADPNGLAPFRRTLLSRHANSQRKLRDSQASEQALRDLRAARDRVAAWPLSGEGAAALAPGVEQIYRRGRKAFKAAQREPSTQHLHELRKRAKDLWYTGQIVRSAAPEAFGPITDDAHELSELIGKEHDLAILAETASERPDRFSGDVSLDDLLDLIEKRRRKLQRKALKVGARLYAKKPKKVARGLA